MTWHRSCVAGAAKLVTEHGHAKLQLQFSKYVPSSFQLMDTPPVRASQNRQRLLRSDDEPGAARTDEDAQAERGGEGRLCADRARRTGGHYQADVRPGVRLRQRQH